MTTKLEKLPNEIFIDIFSYLSWNEILISFWSLNKRIISLIYSIFSMNKNGIHLNQPGLSYKEFSLILLPLICNSSSLSSAIKYIHIDGLHSNSCYLIHQWLFDKNVNEKIRFQNLKSFHITRCLLSEKLIQILSKLIHGQLNELTLTLDEDILESIQNPEDRWRIVTCASNKLLLFIFEDR
jgi:hypothetical protein